MLNETSMIIGNVIKKTHRPPRRAADGRRGARRPCIDRSILPCKTEKAGAGRDSTELAAEIANYPALAGITVEAKGPYINFVFGSGYVSGAVRKR